MTHFYLFFSILAKPQVERPKHSFKDEPAPFAIGLTTFKSFEANSLGKSLVMEATSSSAGINTTVGNQARKVDGHKKKLTIIAKQASQVTAQPPRPPTAPPYGTSSFHRSRNYLDNNSELT